MYMRESGEVGKSTIIDLCRNLYIYRVSFRSDTASLAPKPWLASQIPIIGRIRILLAYCRVKMEY